MEVKIYSTPTCPYCKMVKDYFLAKGIPYQDFDVSTDKQAMEEMIKSSGQMAVPVIMVNGEIVVGFDRPRLDSLLQL